MSGRSLLLALAASVLLMTVGAVANDATAVAGGLVSSVVAGICLAIKTNDTTKPANALLFDKADQG